MAFVHGYDCCAFIFWGEIGVMRITGKRNDFLQKCAFHCTDQYITLSTATLTVHE